MGIRRPYSTTPWQSNFKDLRSLFKSSLSIFLYNKSDLKSERVRMQEKTNQNRRKESTSDYTKDHFERRQDDYQMIPATTPELKKIFNQIRYIVFCENHAEFNVPHNIDKTEEDIYDSHALHFLLLYKPLHMFIGGTRIILPMPHEDGCGLPSVQIDHSPFQQQRLFDLTKMAELSRLMIAKDRMKLIKMHCSHDVHDPAYVHPVHHMIRCVFNTCYNYNLIGFIAALEEPLFRLAKAFQLPITKYGNPIHHFGVRQPGYLLIEPYLKQLKELNPRFHNFITEINIDQEN